MKAKVYSANIKGTFTQLKAYRKSTAVRRFRQLDDSIRGKDVYMLNVSNSHQGCVEVLYPGI